MPWTYMGGRMSGRRGIDGGGERVEGSEAVADGLDGGLGVMVSLDTWASIWTFFSQGQWEGFEIMSGGKIEE